MYIYYMCVHIYMFMCVCEGAYMSAVAGGGSECPEMSSRAQDRRRVRRSGRCVDEIREVERCARPRASGELCRTCRSVKKKFSLFIPRG